MAKQQIIIKLVGVLESGLAASTQQADKVVAFVDRLENPKFTVKRVPEERRVILTTQQDTYHIGKSLTIKNLYQGQCNGNKVHVTLKKLVGKVIYWAELSLERRAHDLVMATEKMSTEEATAYIQAALKVMPDLGKAGVIVHWLTQNS